MTNDFETELLDAKRELEHYKLLEFEAQERLVLVEEQTESLKKKSLETGKQLRLVNDSLYSKLQQHKQEHKQVLVSKAIHLLMIQLADQMYNMISYI